MNKIIYRVYVDESGMTQKYNDIEQPALCLTGVITKKNEFEFNRQVIDMLKNYCIESIDEIHTSGVLKGESPFTILKKEDRENLLLKFIQIGNENIDYIHSVGMLKPFVKNQIREDLRKRNLDPYLNALYFFLIEIDLFFNVTLNSYYEIYFDRSDSFKNRTQKMISELMRNNLQYYSLNRIIKPPEQVDSKNSRYIQLADAIGFMLAKYRQIEVTNYNHSIALDKYESFIKKCFNLIKPKLIPRISALTYKDVFDPKELSERDFSHLGSWLTRTKTDDSYDYIFNKNLKQSKNRILEFINTLQSCIDTHKYQKINHDNRMQISRLIKEIQQATQYIQDTSLKNQLDLILQQLKSYQ